MRHTIALIIPLLLGSVITVAQANPISNVYNVTVWNYACSSCNSDSPAEQALPTTANTVTTGSLVAQFTYTGDINFSMPSGSDTVQAFFDSSGGKITDFSGNALSSLTMSTSDFSTTTLIDFSGYANQAAFGVITHSSGVSLYQNDTNLFDMSESAPSSSLRSPSFKNLAVGNFDLWYVETNGLPAILDDPAYAVPEPSGLVILGMGLVLIGFVARRHYKKS